MQVAEVRYLGQAHNLISNWVQVPWPAPNCMAHYGIGCIDANSYRAESCARLSEGI